MADQTELALQGSLFGLEQEAKKAPPREEAASELDQETLARDAKSRPRTRQRTTTPQEPENSQEQASSNDDLPPGTTTASWIASSSRRCCATTSN